MPDLSTELASRCALELQSEFMRVVDAEGKIPAALDSLGPVAGRDVVVLNASAGHRVGQLVSLGARVVALVPPDEPEAGERPAVKPAAVKPAAEIVAGTPESTGLGDGSTDAVISFWSAFLGPNASQLAEADRILRPGGRLLIIHDYGRDDVCRFWPDAYAQHIEWSQRNGPFLSLGFRIRVIHCWWTFESLGEAERLLGEAFGPAGLELASRMKRPRLEYNIAIYHRTKDGRRQ